MTFVHSLTIERITYDDSVASRDADGQPSASTTTTSVKGLVQPRITSEAEDSRSAGSQIGTHVIFMPAGTDLRHADRIVWGTRRFNPTGIRSFEFGGLQHLEVDAELVTATPVVNTDEAS